MFRKAFHRFLIPALFFSLTALPCLADSHIRIVRLSTVQGSVKIDPGTGQFKRAIQNLPITQGMKLCTGEDGRAEVEFEDGSTVRLAPETAIEFPQLSLRDSGTKLSVVNVIMGTVYAEAVGKEDELTLEFGPEKVAITRGDHVRVGVDKSGAALADFKGDVQIQGPSGNVDVKKNQTANFDFAANGSYKMAKKVQQEPEDDWDKEQGQYRQQYAGKVNSSYSPYAYGMTDLAYYGNFFNAPGYGMMWQPYFAGMGWNPFMDGAWSFSPGFGYGWVSAYPWGWTPYHYGTWVFLPTYGWAWQPGGVWTPMYTQMAVLNAPAGFVAPRPPASGKATVMVGRTSAMSGVSGTRLVIKSNSAGLGVPRGELDNMPKLSQKVEKRGVVTQEVAAAPGAERSSAYHPLMGPRGEVVHGAEPHEMSFPAPSATSGSSHASGGSPRK